MSADLRDAAQGLLSRLKAHMLPGMEGELYLSRSEERSLELRDGAVDAVEQSALQGMGLRLFQGGRLGFACAGEVSHEALDDLYRQASAQLPHQRPDAARALPAPQAARADPELETGLLDSSLFAQDWEALKPRLLEMDEAVRRFDPRIESVLRAGYEEARGEVVIASTLGVLTRETGGSVSVGVSALAGDGADQQVGSAFQSCRRRQRLDFSRVARECAERTVALLGSRKLPGGRRAVLFDPWIAGEFLELVSGLLCADQVQRGKSLLAGRLGKKVGSSLATFVDDPRMKEGMASALFDDEGLPTKRKVLIEQGVAREFFYDTYTANREGGENNASAARGSYRGLPSPASTNFYLAPGGLSRDAVLKDTQDGILILDVMGMHMADPISGEFSIGVSGLAVSAGRLGPAVKNAMISGNLLDLLANIDAVADDLTFHGSMGAPTFRVAGLSVA